MELDKEFIKQNFKKSFLTYEDNAHIQKETADKIVSLIKGKNFNKVLEIGSYSGYLTRLLDKNITYLNYSAIDIVEESEFVVKKINKNINFYNCDVENFETKEKFDLIISNASLQWCQSLKNTIEKLKSYLASEGKIIVSVFAEGNLYQIKNSFNIGLDYPDIKEIKNIFSKNAKIIEITKDICFDNPYEILKHLKKTGVNSIRKTRLSLIETKKGLKILEKEYNNTITYKPVIIID